MEQILRAVLTEAWAGSNRRLWMDQVVAVGDDLPPRPALAGDLEADVAIVGAGFTGLWTAYYLARADPRCASSCSRTRSPASARRAQRRLVLGAVPGDSAAWPAGTAAPPRSRWRRDAGHRRRGRPVAAEEGIDCHFAKGGTVDARPDARRTSCGGPRAEAGFGWRRRRRRPALVGATRVLGATYTPHCAAFHPARLVRGLAARSSGAACRSTSTPRPRRSGPARWSPTGGASARARWSGPPRPTPTLPGSRRERWCRSTRSWWRPSRCRRRSGTAPGSPAGQTFADHRHLIIYGQRTADDRIAFGGRGAPYHFGSRDRARRSTASPRCFAGLRRTLGELFPALAERRVHPRLGRPARHRRGTGTRRSASTARPAWPGPAATSATAWRTTNLAGRTLADLDHRAATPS